MICHIRQCPKLRLCFKTQYNFVLIWPYGGSNGLIQKNILIIHWKWSKFCVFLFSKSCIFKLILPQETKATIVAQSTDVLYIRSVFLSFWAASEHIHHKAPLNNLSQKWKDYWWLSLRTHGRSSANLAVQQKKKRKKKRWPFAKFLKNLHKPHSVNMSGLKCVDVERERECVCVWVLCSKMLKCWKVIHFFITN